MIYGVQRNEMMWANIRTCYWLSGYQSLQWSLCPRWQQTQACIDNGPASSEKSVSNCLWCWPTHRQNHSDIHADGMKTRCPRLQMRALGSSVMKRQKSELNCTVSWAELGYLDDMIQDDERTMTHSDSLETHSCGYTLNVILTSWTFSLALMSDGWTREPMTFRLPWTTRASSGRSVLMPTLPWWYTESGSWPRCHSTSLSLSNWPGLDAWRKDNGEGAQTNSASDISETYA